MKRAVLLYVFISFAVNAFSQIEIDSITQNRLDSINTLSIESAEKNDYKKAIEYKKELLDSLKSYVGVNHHDFWYEQINLSIYYSKIGDFDQAISITQDVLSSVERTLGKENEHYITFLQDLNTHYDFSGNNYPEAINSELKALDLISKVYGNGSLEYAISLSKIGYYYTKMRDGEHAIMYLCEACPKIDSINGEKNDQYYSCISSLSMAYLLSNYFDKAIETGKECVSIAKELYGELSDDYLWALHLLESEYYGAQLYHECFSLLFKRDSCDMIKYGEKSIKHINNLYDLGLYYHKVYKNIEALNCFNKAKDLLNTIGVVESKLYGKIMQHAASVYSDLGDYTSAEESIVEAIEKFKKLDEKSNIAQCTYFYGTFLLNMGEYPQAIVQYENALAIYRVIDKKGVGTSNVLHNIAVCYLHLGDYEEAMLYANKSLEIRTKLFGVNSPRTASVLRTIAAIMNERGEFDKAILLGERACEIIKSNLGIYNSSYATALGNLGCDYLSYRDEDSAVIAIGYIKEAISIKDSVFGSGHSRTSSNYGNIAYYYEINNKFDSALVYRKKAMNASKVLNIRHPSAIKDVLNVANAYYYMGKYDSAMSYLISSANLAKEHVLSSFNLLPNRQRTTLWNQYSLTYNRDIPRLIQKKQENELVKCGLNSTLFSKGLLLNTDISVKDMIVRTGDTSIMLLYDTLKLTRLQIDRLYELEPDKIYCSIDSLERVADALERRLMRQSKVYGDFTHNLSIDWKEVQSKLKKGEAAVEFVNFEENDTNHYAAYVVRRGDKSPQWVPLKPIPTGHKINDTSVYTTAQLSRWLWGELATSLKGVKTVYFAPSGELYNIAIEYLPDFQDSAKHIFDRWQLHRLSSTRELALRKEKYNTSSSAVYGGLRYTTDTSFLKRDSERHPQRDREYSMYNLADSLNARAGAMYLPGTREEAINVDSTLRKSHVDNMLYIDTLGTEGVFKAMSGQKKSLLHISTHGFYWTSEEADLHRNIKTLDFSLDESRSRYEEDKALTRSGLLMAGANTALMGGKIPEGVDDGILTAKEIASLDLRGLDMVVLSACQTGLGDVSGEGVFGLQRGFKKAGAQSILMSLWKVDDRATQMLMTQFYHNWTSGMSKQRALTKAQEYLRNYTEQQVTVDDNGEWKSEDERPTRTITVHPFASPHYWAAFILLDALD